MTNQFGTFLYEIEECDDVYYDSLNDNYWKEISSKFPDYSFITTQDHLDAVEFILGKMKEEYQDLEWTGLESEMRNKIKDAISES